MLHRLPLCCSAEGRLNVTVACRRQSTADHTQHSTRSTAYAERPSRDPAALDDWTLAAEPCGIVVQLHSVMHSMLSTARHSMAGLVPFNLSQLGIEAWAAVDMLSTAQHSTAQHSVMLTCAVKPRGLAVLLHSMMLAPRTSPWMMSRSCMYARADTTSCAVVMMANMSGSPDRDRFFRNQPLSIASWKAAPQFLDW